MRQKWKVEERTQKKSRKKTTKLFKHPTSCSIDFFFISFLDVTGSPSSFSLAYTMNIFSFLFFLQQTQLNEWKFMQIQFAFFFIFFSAASS